MVDERQRYLDFVMPIVKEGRGQIAEEDRAFLDQQRILLNLSPGQAEAIEQRVLKAYQTFLQRRSRDTSESARTEQTPAQLPSQQQSVPKWQEQDWQEQDWQEQAEHQPNPDQEQQDIEEVQQAKCRWYEEEFTKALESNHLQDAETQAHLLALQRDLRLPEADILRIERQVYATHWQARPARQSISDLSTAETSLVEPPLPETEVQPARSRLSTAEESSAFSEYYSALQQALAKQNWQQADRITFELLLSLSQQETGWLNRAAIEQLPCPELERIDRLWSEASKGKFGFKRQLNLYFNPLPETQQFIRMSGEQYERALAFSKAVGWWRSGAEFYKYYHQLPSNFQAQPGQFPAFWFWKIPWWKALQLGGLGNSRGGCRVDSQTLDAWMNKLKSCQSQKKHTSEIQQQTEQELLPMPPSQFESPSEAFPSEAPNSEATEPASPQTDRQTDLSLAETVFPDEISDFE